MKKPLLHPARVRLARGASALGIALVAARAATAAEPATLDAELAARVQDLVQSQAPAAREGGKPPRLEVELGRLDPRLRLAPCQRVQPQLPSGRLWGRTRIGLRCVEGPTPWQVWLPLTVRVFAPALVARGRLPAGTVLEKAHLQLAEVDWAAQAQAPLADEGALLGRTLARALQPGQAVLARDLRRQQWFAAGETVRVVARGAGFSVAGEALALGPGLDGQLVRLRIESGRVISARAVAQQRAEIEL